MSYAIASLLKEKLSKINTELEVFNQYDEVAMNCRWEVFQQASRAGYRLETGNLQRNVEQEAIGELDTDEDAYLTSVIIYYTLHFSNKFVIASSAARKKLDRDLRRYEQAHRQCIRVPNDDHELASVRERLRGKVEQQFRSLLMHKTVQMFFSGRKATLEAW
ncbi:hypothetical protein MBANPS3_012357 [Mucor bainieri]